MTDNLNTEAPETTETTTEEVSQETEQQAEQNVEAGNENLLAELDAEITAEASGEALPTATEEEAPVEEQVLAEEVLADESNTESAKPKGKQSARERIKDLTDRNKAEAASAQAANERADRLESELADLKDIVKTQLTAPDEEEEDDFVPVDQEAYDKQEQRFAKMEDQRKADNFMAAVKQADETYGANDKSWDVKKDAVMADAAYDLIISGEAANETEALDMAKEKLATQMYSVHQKGNSIGEFIDKKAKQIARNWPADNAKGKTHDPQIDVVKLDNLRDSAGAPTNKIAPVKSQTGGLLAQINAEIDAEKKQNASTW